MPGFGFGFWKSRKQAAEGLLAPYIRAHWPLNEIGGFRSEVAVAPSPDLTLTDNNTVESNGSGVFGTRADFTRANNEFLSTANYSSLFPPAGSFTVFGWTEFKSQPPSTQQFGLLSINGIAGLTMAWSASSFRMFFRLYEAGGNRDLYFTPPGNVQLNERILVAFIYDTESMESRIRWWAPTNGFATDERAVDGTGIVNVTGSTLEIGRAATASRALNGYMEGWYVLHTAITEADFTFLTGVTPGDGRTLAEVLAYTGA